MKRIEQVERFVKTTAWRMVSHELRIVAVNGDGSVSDDEQEYWSTLFDKVTGDTSYDNLPREVKEAYEYMGEVEELSRQLVRAYSQVLDTIRCLSVANHGLSILVDVELNYM